MDKNSNLIAIIIAGVIAIIPGSIALINDFREDKYNRHEQMIASYQGQIKSAEERGAKNIADSKRKEYEQYEEGWRAGQTIEKESIQLVYLYPEGVPEQQKKKFSDALTAIEDSPVATSTLNSSLGAAYYGVGDYENALGTLTVGLLDDPDDTDAKLLKAATLVSIAATSPKVEITGAPPEPGITLEITGALPEPSISAIELITEANELIIFDNTELSKPQTYFIDKIKTDIDKLELKINE